MRGAPELPTRGRHWRLISCGLEKVWDAEWIVAAAAALQGEQPEVPQAERAELRVHLVVDTGLGREGCLPADAMPLAQTVRLQSVGACVSGAGAALCTHSRGACSALSGGPLRWLLWPHPERPWASPA